MKTVSIKTTETKSGATATVNYQVPETVEEAINAYGEKTVLPMIIESLYRKVRAGMKMKILAGASEGEIQEWANTYIPNCERQRVPKTEKVSRLLKDLSPEELKEVLKKYKQ